MDDTLTVPTHAEILSRWPGMSQEQVFELSSEYEAQAKRLAELDLVDVYDRIKALDSSDSDVFNS
jgi:hypothetical protein